jgi:4-hydroxybenzoate polyprenyltransferase
MRPSHWTKNLFIFAALIFGKKLIGPVNEVFLSVFEAFGGFILFSLAASAIYVFNDIIDRNGDRLHPQKAGRPVASGEISVSSAAIFAVFLASVSLVSSYNLNKSFFIILIVYLAMMILYTLFLKKIMILDCVIISIGFCLRAITGAILVGVPISPWLIICTFALCLFLAFGKRRTEVAQLGEKGVNYRQALAGYTPELLAHMLDVTSGLAIVCFLLYSMDERTKHTFGTNNLVYTTPFVLYCIFRFSAMIQKGRYTGPVQIILKDIAFQAGFILWVIVCFVIIYANKLGYPLSNIWSY